MADAMLLLLKVKGCFACLQLHIWHSLCAGCRCSPLGSFIQPLGSLGARWNIGRGATLGSICLGFASRCGAAVKLGVRRAVMVSLYAAWEQRPTLYCM